MHFASSKQSVSWDIVKEKVSSLCIPEFYETLFATFVAERLAKCIIFSRIISRQSDFLYVHLGHLWIIRLMRLTQLSCYQRVFIELIRRLSINKVFSSSDFTLKKLLEKMKCSYQQVWKQIPAFILQLILARKETAVWKGVVKLSFHNYRVDGYR